MKKRFCLIAFCLAIFIPCMNVNVLQVRRGDEVLLAAPLPYGAPFETFYIHSVQLTPVIDEYRILNGKIWSWEERVQSHNAGLPFSAPEHGRFLVKSPWMIVQGGRVATTNIAYRVGTEEFGQNRWRLPPFEEVRAYASYPRVRVDIAVKTDKLFRTRVIGWQDGESPVGAQSPRGTKEENRAR